MGDFPDLVCFLGWDGGLNLGLHAAFFFFFFLMFFGGPGVELRALHLLGRHSYPLEPQL
jgi:hypothetical protein